MVSLIDNVALTEANDQPDSTYYLLQLIGHINSLPGYYMNKVLTPLQFASVKSGQLVNIAKETDTLTRVNTALLPYLPTSHTILNLSGYNSPGLLTIGDNVLQLLGLISNDEYNTINRSLALLGLSKAVVFGGTEEINLIITDKVSEYFAEETSNGSALQRTDNYLSLIPRSETEGMDLSGLLARQQAEIASLRMKLATYRTLAADLASIGHSQPVLERPNSQEDPLTHEKNVTRGLIAKIINCIRNK